MACGGFLRSPVDATYSGLLEREKLGNLASLSRPLAADRFVSFLFFFFFRIVAERKFALLACNSQVADWIILSLRIELLVPIPIPIPSRSSA